MKLDSSGCLQCRKAPSFCTQVKKRKLHAPRQGELVSQAVASGLLHAKDLSSVPGNKSNINSCDGNVALALRYNSKVIPRTYHDGPVGPCDLFQGPGLCCYLPKGSFGYGMMGFQLIEDHNYIYRIEYTPDQDENFTVLKTILRFCKYPSSADKCPDGEPVEDLEPEPKKPINASTPTTSSTRPSLLESHPSSAATLGKRDEWSLTTSRDVTGLPDIYFPTPTSTRSSSGSVATAVASRSQADPELKINLGSINAAQVVEIMLAATNIDEVKNVSLSLRVSTECYTDLDGRVECQKVYVGMEGAKLSNVIPGNAEPTASNQNAEISVTTLSKRFDTPPPVVTSSTTPPRRFDDGVQAVLGLIPNLHGAEDAHALIPDEANSQDHPQAQARDKYVGSSKRSEPLKVVN